MMWEYSMGKNGMVREWIERVRDLTPLPINHAPLTPPQKYIQKMQKNVQKHAFSHPPHICITVIIFSSMVLPVEFYHEAPRG
jgi:hypothetical protein